LHAMINRSAVSTSTLSPKSVWAILPIIPPPLTNPAMMSTTWAVHERPTWHKAAFTVLSSVLDASVSKSLANLSSLAPHSGLTLVFIKGTSAGSLLRILDKSMALSAGFSASSERGRATRRTTSSSRSLGKCIGA
jgi:hypothetical protein